MLAGNPGENSAKSPQNWVQPGTFGVTSLFPSYRSDTGDFSYRRHEFKSRQILAFFVVFFVSSVRLYIMPYIFHVFCFERQSVHDQLGLPLSQRYAQIGLIREAQEVVVRCAFVRFTAGQARRNKP